MPETGNFKEKKFRYPFSIFFIIGNEFCERFNYYGMRTVLSLYLNRELGYDMNLSTVVFHVFTMLVYFMCIPGALIADSWLGKFSTIFYLSIVYVAGSLMVTFGAIGPLHLPAIEMTLIGLVLIAIGSGGIKPCVSAFGGDQFKLPEQVKQMATFFSLFYFSINSGSLISTSITPLLRENIHCFGTKSCYPLAFGVPAVLMAISIVIFVLGKKLYKTKPPAGNMVVMVSKTISNAISTRIKEKKTNPREHWLDYANHKFDQQLIDDVKVLLRVLVLYIPLPIFWALFDQQGSRWTFQATRMDGSVGSFEIQPDQLQTVNPLLILLFIPLYEYAFYPLLSKIGIRRPLQKLACGGVLAGVAFVISGCIELNLEKTYPVLPTPGISQLRLFNGINDCNYLVKTDIPEHKEFKLLSLSEFEAKYIDVSKTENFTFNFEAQGTGGCPSLTDQKIHLESNEAISYFLYNDGNEMKLYRYKDYVDKPKHGNPQIRVLANLKTLDYIQWRTNNDIPYNQLSNITNLTELYSGTFDVYVGSEKILNNYRIRSGGIYTLILTENNNKNEIKNKIYIITEPNTFHMLWLVPQYIVMTLGEVMFSVTGLEFSYAEAPNSMKSVLQACWLLTVAIGNLVVVIIAESKLFKSQAYEFFLFAVLMFLDMIFFAFLAIKYKSNRMKNDSEKSDND